VDSEFLREVGGRPWCTTWRGPHCSSRNDAPGRSYSPWAGYEVRLRPAGGASATCDHAARSARTSAPSENRTRTAEVVKVTYTAKSPGAVHRHQRSAERLGEEPAPAGPSAGAQAAGLAGLRAAAEGAAQGRSVWPADPSVSPRETSRRRPSSVAAPARSPASWHPDALFLSWHWF